MQSCQASPRHGPPTFTPAIPAKPFYGLLAMNTQEIKKLLKYIKPERIRISDQVRFKIERVHGVSWDEVLKNLREPALLTHTEQQPSRGPHDETYGLLFELTKRRRMFVVITYKPLKTGYIL